MRSNVGRSTFVEYDMRKAMVTVHSYVSYKIRNLFNHVKNV